jgi:hypothetical protein
MNLSIEDAQLFFKLFFALLAYANRELKIVPNVSKAGDIPKAGAEGAASIRDALYKQPKLIERFVAENPEGLSSEELATIETWKHRISGDFYVMRYLKKYAVFMPMKKTEHLYGVLGLYDSFDTVFRGQPLPVALKATLLPFKGQIIYDGIAAPYSVLFGPGIRADLDDTYKRLKQKEGIVEQLLNPDGKPEIRTSLKERAGKPAPDWKPVISEMAAQADRMRRAGTPEQTAALALLRAAAHLALAAFDEASETGNEVKQVRRALTRLENLRYEEDF